MCRLAGIFFLSLNVLRSVANLSLQVQNSIILVISNQCAAAQGVLHEAVGLVPDVCA